MHPRTHGSPLLAWLHDPSADRGIHFAQADGSWSFCAYERLAEMARAAAAGLVGQGVSGNEVVALIGRSTPELVAAFFGTLLAGATPAPMAPPAAFQGQDAYGDHTRGVLRRTRPALAVADAELLEELVPIVAGVSRLACFDSLRGDGAARAEPAEIALLQLTSGSSGAARAVRIPRSALEANVAAIGRWLRWTPDAPFVSWLPLYHDMGLVGALICPVVNGGDLWLFQPEHFIRDPLRYLRCLAGSGAELSAIPAFGLDLSVRKVAPAALEGLDFSRVRGMVVGAERVRAETLERFHAFLEPYGLRRDALLPAYGLAEATLAATGVPPGRGWMAATVDPASLVPGHAVRTLDVGGAVVTGCGVPLDGVSVSIVDESGAPLADGHVGEIVVSGASLSAGYLGEPPSEGGELRTGDGGFVLDGELYVLGRLGDSIKVRGRVLFSEELEAALAGLGASSQRAAVLLGSHEGAPTAVLLTEEPDPAWRAAAVKLLRRQADGARVAFVAVPRGGIARTSSGKPRRRPLWDAFVAGRLPGKAEWEGTSTAGEEIV
ncbi:MAG TPA: AMP-binding protein, partial [Longimicrobium sp.]|jgi:acyl-CoA synthetase (AMP-forming)/AMP-acid ligase II